MKKIVFLTTSLLIIISLFYTSCSQKKNPVFAKNNEGLTIVARGDTSDISNDFYDNADTYELPSTPLKIEGEIENPGTIDFSKLPLHSVIVKEAILDTSGNKFTGAFKYEGYSLYDILNTIRVKKANAKEFERIIDMYVQVENAKGEKVFLSWGELYYPVHRHEIIIATRVMRIVPSVTNELWKLPEESKLIVSADLLTERNISAPAKIIVKSYPRSFPTKKGLKPNFSPEIKIYSENRLEETLTGYPKDLQIQKYDAIFYGRGKGIHSTNPFTGILLKEVMAKYFKTTKENLQKGIFLVIAKDGYRAVFTFSELMNRNDQEEVLLLCRPETKENGIFKLFPACDFFSDRAVKGISAIYFSINEK